MSCSTSTTAAGRGWEGSLLDYVLVDSERVLVEQYRRVDGEQWQLFEHGEGGRLTFAGLPGSIAVNDVYPRGWPA